MQKARSHPTQGLEPACRHMISGSVSLPCSGFFSPFPHGTGSLSVSRVVFSLAGWSRADSRRISRVPRYSGACLFDIRRISPQGLSPASARLSSRFGYPGYQIYRQALQPRMMRCHISGLGSSAFARHYLRNNCYFLFLRVLRCFSSPGSPLRIPQIRNRFRWVAHSEIRGSMGICPSRAYRSLSRPSSPPRAKASFMCPCLLSLVSFDLTHLLMSPPYIVVYFAKLVTRISICLS